MNTLGFVSYTDSFAAIQLCCSNVEAALDNRWVNECGCIPILDLQKQTAGAFELESPIFDYLWLTKSAASCGSM